MIGRTLLLRAAGALVLALWAAGAAAQSYPDKPVKMVVPYAAGGFSDALGRALAQRFAESMGQPVIVENRPGASTNIGFAAVAKAPADGYTILLGTGAPTINPFLFSKMPYDAERDFAPIGRVVDLPYVLVAHPSVPANSFKELIAYAKANPGKLNIGTPGNGTSPHLAVKLLEQSAGISLQSVHYKGNGPALNDLLGGQIHLLFDGLQQPAPFVRSGRLKLLAVASLQRMPGLPDVPAVAESYPGYEALTWYQLLAPAGTPAPVIAKLNAEIQKFIADPVQSEQLLSQGAVARGGTPQQAADYAKAQTARWGALIKEHGIRLD